MLASPPCCIKTSEKEEKVRLMNGWEKDMGEMRGEVKERKGESK